MFERLDNEKAEEIRKNSPEVLALPKNLQK